MKKMLALLLVLVLAFSVAIPAAGASGFGDGIKKLWDKVQSTFGGEDGEDEYVVERLVKKLVNVIREKCEEQGIDPSEILGQIQELITDENGNIDASKVIALIGSFTTGGVSDESEEELAQELGQYIDMYRAREAAITAYMIEKYKDTLEPGDVQVVSYVTLSNEEDDLREALGYYALLNYTVDGKDLKLKNSAGAVEYMLFEVDEEMNFTLVEEVVAEEGENFDASVDALCERHKVKRSDFNHTLSGNNIMWAQALDLAHYLANHPEYERFEFEGEMKTEAELEAISDEYFDRLMEEAFAAAE